MSHEPCTCCGIPASDDDGGETHNGQRWCWICVGRGHHDADDLVELLKGQADE